MPAAESAPPWKNGAEADNDRRADAAPTTDRSRQIDAIVAELKSGGSLDSSSEARLVRDLEQSDPDLWPELVRNFRTAAAYQRRAARDKQRDEGGRREPAASQPATDDSEIAHEAPAREEKPDVHAASATTSVESHETAAEPARPAADRTWQDSLDEAIAGLERETQSPPRMAGDMAAHAHLRMLYLAAGRRDDALRPIAGTTPAERDFWTGELYGLSTYLDTRGTTDRGRRAAEAAQHLSKANLHLSESAALTVRNLHFCTEVKSYGVYTPFDQTQFKPGQQVLIYVEVENFKSDDTPQGYHTSLRGSYQVLDAQGRRVEERELPLTEDYCRNPRRDYSIRYFLTIPARTYDGSYTLQLTLEDTLGQKIGQATAEFQVQEKAEK